MSDLALEQLQTLRGHVFALDRFCFEPGRVPNSVDGDRNRSYVGGPQEYSPAPHNRQRAIHLLIEECQEVRRTLQKERPDLTWPEPPQMPPGLYEFPPNDNRNWLAFRDAVGRLREWVNGFWEKVGAPPSAEVARPGASMAGKTAATQPTAEPTITPPTVRDWLHAVASRELRNATPVADANEMVPADIYYLRRVYAGRGTPHPWLATDHYLPLLQIWVRDTIGRDAGREALFALVGELRGRILGLSNDGAFDMTLEQAARTMGLVATPEEVPERDAAGRGRGEGQGEGAGRPVQGWNIMSDLEYAEAVLHSLETLIAAGNDLDAAERTTPYDGGASLARFQTVKTRASEFGNYASLRLDNLAERYLHCRAGEWAAQLLDQVLNCGPGISIDEYLTAMKRRRYSLGLLVQLLKNDRASADVSSVSGGAGGGEGAGAWTTCRRTATCVRNMIPSNDEPRPEPPKPSDPRSIVDSLLSEAESRQQEEAETRRIAAECARRLNEQKVLRERLADAFEGAYRFTNEEAEQGRKPCPDGFRRWAARFLALGTVMGECDAAIERLRLVERLRTVAERPAPSPMKFACALLILASEGPANDVAPALEKANGDAELRRFVRWLPFILDNLWHPFPREDGLIPVALSPDETGREENQQAEQAFGWRRSADCLDGTAIPSAATPPPSTPLPPLPADPQDKDEAPALSTPLAPEIDLEAQALALLFQHPEWSVAEIADNLKVNPKTPYKWERFRKAAERDGRLKPRGPKSGSPHRGHKTSDGQIEAYTDEDKGE